MQLIYGSLIESIMGSFHIALLYFVSGIGGNLFSCYANNIAQTAVGCSTSVTGILAGALAMVFVNWKEFDKYPQFE